MSGRTDDALVLTLDVDWAPDFVIDAVAAKLITHGVAATWFITHSSPAIDRLRAHPELFELGVHPNFLPGSSHGADATAVLRHNLSLVPEAISMRTHGLVQSTTLLDLVMRESAIRIDVSLFVPRLRHVAPVHYWWRGRRLTRIPYLWEDDFEMERPDPHWNLSPLLASPGLKVLDFHPIHIWLNGADGGAYCALKRRFGDLRSADPVAMADMRRDGPGPGRLFDEVVAALAAEQRSFCIRDLDGVARGGD